MRRKCSCRHGSNHEMHRCEETGFSTGDYLTVVLLKLLKEKPMHGYELYDKLNQTNYYPFKHDPGVIYNILRKLENHGLLTYYVEEGNGGLRKIYQLTKDGEEYFDNMREFIRKLRNSFEEFLKD